MLDVLSSYLNGNSFSMGMFAAEAKQTSMMVYDAAHRIQTALVSYERRDAAGILRALRQTPTAKLLKLTALATASGYLCWKFGWEQAFSDMKLGAEQTAQLIQNTDTDETHVRKTIRKRLPVLCQIPGCESVVAGFQDEGIRVIADLQLSFGEFAKERLGVGDLPSLAFDLVPLSFVANWVYPIGDYLQRAHTLDIFSSAKVVTTSWKRVRINLHTLPGNLQGIPGYWSGSRLYASMAMQRTVSQGLPFSNPPIQWKVPTEFGKAVTAVALLTQRLLGQKAPTRPLSGLNNNSLSFGGELLSVMGRKLR
jgi:hypothetical protein